MSSAPRSASSRMFDGLTSRWTRPAACSASSAAAISADDPRHVGERQRAVLARCGRRATCPRRSAWPGSPCRRRRPPRSRRSGAGGRPRPRRAPRGRSGGRVLVAHEARLEHLQRDDRAVLADRAERRSPSRPRRAARRSGTRRSASPGCRVRRVRLAPQRHVASIGGGRTKAHRSGPVRLAPGVARRRLDRLLRRARHRGAIVATLVLSAGSRSEPEPAIAAATTSAPGPGRAWAGRSTCASGPVRRPARRTAPGPKLRFRRPA